MRTPWRSRLPLARRKELLTRLPELLQSEVHGAMRTRQVFPRSGASERGVHLCPPGQPAVAGRHRLEQPPDTIVGSGQ
jgi:hypothetical protein